MFLPDNRVYVPVENPNMAEKQTKSGHLSMEERLHSYEEIEHSYTEEEALEEAGRCLSCPTHWCQNACPASLPVADFIAKIREKDYEGAYELIHSASTLPEMCSRLCPQEKQCQSNCTRGICTESVAIGKLERFVADWHQAHAKAEKAEKTSGKKVAVIGAGPAGLAVAERLKEGGIEVTLYDREEQAGGLLRYGIPNMKLKREVLERKIDFMKEEGIRFETKKEVDQALAEELQASYDAVILAVGAEETNKPKIGGAEQAKGIYYALDYLSSNIEAEEGRERISAEGKNVVIIGAGDTSRDCLAMALRNGCRSAVQIKRKPEVFGKTHVWQPYPLEAEQVKAEYSQEEYASVFCKDSYRYSSLVKEVKTDEEGRIKSVVLVKTEPKEEESGRTLMQAIPGTETELPCELLLIAAGFSGPRQAIKDAFGLEFGSAYQTSIEKVFACGDCRIGQSLVVKAMADGQKCAQAVLDYLA